MAKIKSFPHYEIEVKDESMRFVFVPEILPLHRPLFLAFAEKGIPNYPYWGSFDELKTWVGEGTFDEFSKWFKHPNLFAKKALQYQKIFFVRIIDEKNAKVADRVVCLETYEKDGVLYLKWILRTLDEIATLVGNNDFTYRTIPTYSCQTTIDETTVTGTGYPIIALQATSPGSWANLAGIKFWYDVEQDTAFEESLGTILYNFGFMEQPYGYDTPLMIRTRFLDEDIKFSFKEGVIDKSTMTYYFFDDRLEWMYEGIELPFNIKVYPENVKTIGQMVIDKGNNAAELASGDPYLVNLIRLKYLDGTAYSNVQFTDDSEPMVKDNIIYAVGGDDGNTDYNTLCTYTEAWLNGTVFPEIRDSARYPVTHLYDSGYPIDTKYKLIDFAGIKEDVKIVLSTQDISKDDVEHIRPNSKSEDISTGSALRGRCLLHPESFVYGTQACRFSIYMQCGKLADNLNWKIWTPATYDNLVKRCTFHNSYYVKGVPKPLPYSAVDVFKEVSWTPVMDDIKQLSWDSGLNYFQYYDRTSVHYPDMRSVYPYDTSVFSSDWYIDYIVYLKHIIRETWSDFVGSEEPFASLANKVTKRLNERINTAFGSYIGGWQVNMYQTEIDAALGWQATIEISLYGFVPNRVWKIIVRNLRAK